MVDRLQQVRVHLADIPPVTSCPSSEMHQHNLCTLEGPPAPSPPGNSNRLAQRLAKRALGHQRPHTRWWLAPYLVPRRSLRRLIPVFRWILNGPVPVSGRMQQHVRDQSRRDSIAVVWAFVCFVKPLSSCTNGLIASLTRGPVVKDICSTPSLDCACLVGPAIPASCAVRVNRTV